MTSNGIRYGAVLPGGSATEQLELGLLAEQAGWDGVFTWEAAYGVDPWSLLAAMAVRTSRVRLGTMLTPLPWRRPWKLASQVATLDQLSGGRAILAAGVGATDTNLPDTGEVTDLRGRAEMLDEGIDLIRALWDGQSEYRGKRYRYQSGRMDLAAAVRPVQDRIPLWVVGVWPGEKSMRRVLRCDGVIPQYRLSGRPPEPADARAARDWLTDEGARPDLDVVADGETPAGDPAAARAQVAAWDQAGCTWWLETRWGVQEDLADRMRAMRDRLEAGPPAGGPAEGALH
ncbi:MAG TPA: LLM class flavin-dependent oxidoreductase [Streptosporangiaceae bacterium]|nr:LLM class flavin-dependent oxidoreductase [Streptosporangiaceae bacterium]